LSPKRFFLGVLMIAATVFCARGLYAQTPSNNPAESNVLIRHCLEFPDACNKPSWSPDLSSPQAREALKQIQTVNEAWANGQAREKEWLKAMMSVETFRVPPGGLPGHKYAKGTSPVLIRLPGNLGGLVVGKCVEGLKVKGVRPHWCKVHLKKGQVWADGMKLIGQLTGMAPAQRPSKVYREKLAAVAGQ